MKTVPLTCAGCDKKMQRTASSAPQGKARCRECRKVYVSFEHGIATSYKKGCRCRPCKDAKNAEVRAYNAKKKLEAGVSGTAQYKRKLKGHDPIAGPKYPNCSYCNLPLKRNSTALRPAHKECKGKLPAWFRKGLDNPRRVSFQAKIDNISAGTSGGGMVWTSGPCEWCGDEFVGVGFTCSDRCRSNRKFSKSSEWGKAKSPAARKRIYERDSWTCQICFRPVDVSAGHGSAFYPSLDHIVPRAAMIIPDHSAENLRTVHAICNSYRRDDAVSDEEVREIVLNLYPIAV